MSEYAAPLRDMQLVLRERAGVDAIGVSTRLHADHVLALAYAVCQGAGGDLDLADDPF